MTNIIPARIPILRSSLPMKGYRTPADTPDEPDVLGEVGTGTAGSEVSYASGCGATLVTISRLFLLRAEGLVRPRLDLPGI